MSQQCHRRPLADILARSIFCVCIDVCTMSVCVPYMGFQPRQADTRIIMEIKPLIRGANLQSAVHRTCIEQARYHGCKSSRWCPVQLLLEEGRRKRKHLQLMDDSEAESRSQTRFRLKPGGWRVSLRLSAPVCVSLVVQLSAQAYPGSARPS